jgi:hypothetical protein
MNKILLKMKNLTSLVLLVCTLFFYGCDQGLGVGNDLSDGNIAKNGSYTKMLIVKNRLYGVSLSDISTLDISDKKNPKLLDKKRLGFGVESIFHYQGLLLIGSNQQMYIMKMDANGVPNLESQARYFDVEVGSCDPIVAHSTNAYVTLSPNTITGFGNCGIQRNTAQPLLIGQLRSYDITDIKNPILKSTIDVSNPKGLAIDGEYLYVCNSDKGVNIYNIGKNKFVPELLYTSDPFEAYDVIVNNGIITVVGGKNLHQYNLEKQSGKISLKKLSTIEL